MNRLATLFAIAAFLVIAAPAQAAPPAAAEPTTTAVGLASLSVLENELYAEARVTRDLMVALHDAGALGTEEGQAAMTALRDQLARIQTQVEAAKAQRKMIVAAKRTDRVTRALALRDRSDTPRAVRNARR